jgi:peptidoglycan/LPS O-acetylase OafA/YrhL
MREPLAALTTAVRLRVAAGLSVLALGLRWSPSEGGGTVASQAPVRVFLAGALVALVYAAARTRSPETRRIGRAATVCLAVAAVLAAADRSVPVLLCVLAAVAFAAPPTWRNPRNAGAFGTGPRDR